MTPERLQEIREHDKADSFSSVGWAKYNRAFEEREELLDYIDLLHEEIRLGREELVTEKHKALQHLKDHHTRKSDHD